MNATRFSLALAQWGSSVRPSSTFYLIHTRAWELFAGSLCAFYVARRPVAASSLLSGAGLVMILCAVFVYDHTVPFPSVYALLPVIGTCLVLLFAQQGTWTASLLAVRPMVGLGLLSYSAYLWHQPLFAFARLRSLHEPEHWLMAVLGAVSFVLAYVSWRYVEAPFRKAKGAPARLLPSQRGVFAASVAGLLVMTLAGTGIYLTKGAPWRLPAETYAFIEAKSDRNPRRPICHFSVNEGATLPDLPVPDCVFGADETAPRALLLGDSHGDSLAFGTANVLERAGWQVEQATVSACGPFPGFRKTGRDCHRANLALMDYARSERFDLIVLGFRPQPLLTVKGFDNGEGGVEPDFSGPALYDAAYLGLPPDAEPSVYLERVLQRGLAQYLETGAAVVVVYPVPEAGWNVPETAAKVVMYENRTTPDLSTDYAMYLERNGATIAMLDRIVHPNLFRIRPAETLCAAALTGGQGNRCANTVGATALYFDDDHLSNAGVDLLMPEFGALLERLPVARRDPR